MKLKLTAEAAQAVVVKILDDLGIEIKAYNDLSVEIIPEVEDMMLINNVILDADGIIDYKAIYSDQKIFMEWVDIDSELIPSCRLRLVG